MYSSGRAAENSSLPAKRARLLRLAAWSVDVDDGVANDVDSSAYYCSRELQSFQMSLLVFSDL